MNRAFSKTFRNSRNEFLKILKLLLLLCLLIMDKSKKTTEQVYLYNPTKPRFVRCSRNCIPKTFTAIWEIK